MDDEPKNKVRYIEVEKLELLENNPRTITKAQMDTLIQSLRDNEDYFEARPLIVSNRTGKNVIIAGNQRYRAACELGFDRVPCVILEGLTEEREQEIIIRDNVSNGEWDYDLLANEWDSAKLSEWGVQRLPIESKVDIDSFFEQSDAQEAPHEPKKVVCPNCGEEIEV